jgi:methyl-accepting chemotaxis protein
MFLDKLTIKMRIIASFSIFLMLFMIFGMWNVEAFKSIAQENKEMEEKHIPFLLTSTETSKQMYKLHTTLQEIARPSMGITTLNLEEEVRQASSKIEENLALLESFTEEMHTDEMRTLYTNYVTNWKHYEEVSEKVVGEAKEKNWDVAQDEQFKSVAFFDQASLHMETIQTTIQNEMKEQANDTVNKSELAMISSVLFGVVAIALAIGLSFITQRYIRQPIMVISSYVEHIANGDLSKGTLEIKGKDELGHLAKGVTIMKDAIHSIFSNIKTHHSHTTVTADQLYEQMQHALDGMEKVAASMDEMAIKSQEQVSEISNSATLLHNVKDVVEGVSHVATEMQQLSDEVKGATASGLRDMDVMQENTDKMEQSMGQSVEAMSTLDEQMNQIDKIIQTIESMASQTNLLALNAQVEAARAGEYGKGFGVVADEVRQLADQSKIATKEINGMIQSIKQQKDHVSANMEKTKQHTIENRTNMERTYKQFKAIDQMATNVSTQNITIAMQMKEVSEKVKEVMEFSRKVKGTADHHASHAQTIAAITQEMQAIVGEVHAGVKDVTDSSQQLQQQMDRYQLT